MTWASGRLNRPRTLVAALPAGADQGDVDHVARGDEARPAEDVPRHDRDRGGGFEEGTARGVTGIGHWGNTCD